MVTSSSISAKSITAAIIALVALAGNPRPVLGQSTPKVDIEGKVVLANLDRYSANFRVGSVRKEIAPNKASLLRPKRFPIAIEIWNGARTGPAWEPKTIPDAGVYAFQYQSGRWTLSKHQPSAAVTRTRGTTASRPSIRRVTGSTPRVVRGSGRVYYGGRFPLLTRVAGDVLWLYRFVRDEDDRDLIRDIIIGREIDREIERELWDRLDDIAVNLPAYERLEFERALDDLRDLDDQDLKDLEDATENEWEQVRDTLGDQVTDNAWRELDSDFGDIEIDDLSEEEITDLEEAGIDSLDSDIDIGDLAGGDIDISDLSGTLDNIDLSDLSGGIEDIDVGDIGGDFSGDVGGDPGGELGGDFGGGFDDSGFDGGGFDYDAGGFDDFGGGFDGGGFDGGGFDDFGGGFDDF
jgi:hypothetical protein